jgi:Amt family ammonium transporter
MRLTGLIGAGAALLAASAAQAQPVVIADSGDTAWVLAASVLTLLAVLPGLALFYGRGQLEATGFGLFGGIALASLLFAAIGYSLAFGEGSSLLGGAGNAMFANFSELLDGATISEGVYALFETVAALFAIGILSASVAGTARPGWLVPFSGLWLLLVYVPVAHWVWPGWLGDLGTLDYAGGIVIQLTAGVAALVIGFLLRSSSTSESVIEPSLTIAGAALLWVGFLAFFGAAALGGSDDAATAILNGHLAASASILVGLVIKRRASAYYAATGAISGLAAVAAAGALVGPAGAMALGAIGAVAAWAAGGFVERAKLGSPAAAFTVHGASAIAGAILFPVFMLPALGGPGFDEGNGLVPQLAAQAVAVLAVILWTAVATVIAALMVSMVVPMKATGSNFD